MNLDTSFEKLKKLVKRERLQNLEKIENLMTRLTDCTISPYLESAKTKMSANQNQIEYFENYKTYGGFKYHLGIPDNWILHELPNTGRECANCVGNGDNRGFAMWRGIILGYCANCAVTYCGTRCRGFNVHANECYGHQDYESAYDKYLGDIDLENLGDLNANPDDTMENHNKPNIEVQERDYASTDPDSEYERLLNELEKEEDIDRWNEMLQNQKYEECSECEGCWNCQPTCEYDYEECEDYNDSDSDEEEVCLAENCCKLRIGKSAFCKKHQGKPMPSGKRVRQNS